eukprot:TRINITY_DN35416_c0_g1_i1.p1 TRINITY_DN35416_c0_g1~~TRINITY_DN35416_c0_g1_i1.p1  ORF type:complete len:204 (-),score=24.70 TRINITY_DN35416_c0_g1_i1:110-721(-)
MPPPSLTVSCENKLRKSESAGPILGKQNVSGIWWPNHQGWGRTRDLADLDQNFQFDRNDNLPRDKCMDSRARSLTTKDRGLANKFGPRQDPPGQQELDKRKCFDECWMGQIFKSCPSWTSNQARPTHYYDFKHWKLDANNLTQRADYSIASRDRSKYQSFNLGKSDRYDYPKLFSKDYTKSGCSLRLNSYSAKPAWKSPNSKK